MARPSTLERRFDARSANGPLADVRPDLGPCLIWTGRLGARAEIPVIDRGTTTITGYHAAWEIALGEELPKGFVLRHFACTRPLCVRAEHLKPWVAAEDVEHERLVIAWNARHDRCLNGHDLTESRNVITVPGGRSCRRCRRDVANARRRAARSRGVSG